MKKIDLLKLLDCKDLLDVPSKLMSIILGDLSARNEFYKDMLKLNSFELDKDWFQGIYEEELSQRRQNKQDFTPNEVSVLCSMLVNDGSVHEPTAGNGSMLIANWWYYLQKKFVWEYFPSEHQFDCWELSDRSLPFLLLNTSIRGMMGIVHHGDVLEKNEICRYLVINPKDDALAFSEIIKDTTCSKIIKERI